MVTPSLTRDTSLVRRTADWPAWPTVGVQPSGALFEKRPALRKLVVLADDDLLAAADDVMLNQKTMLTALLTHPYIKMFRYRDEGPPADAPRKSYGPQDAGLTVAEGWAELIAPDINGVRGVEYVDGAWIQSGPVYGAGVAHARSDTGSAAYRDLDQEAAAEQRSADVLAAEVAQAVEADLFITERPYLFEPRAPVPHGITVCATPQALAIVGLYLRSQHEFITWRATDTRSRVKMNEWLYFQVGAVELLPELWRWSTASAQAQSEHDREALSGLHNAVLQRMVRALRTRDSFHRVASLPQNRDAVRMMLAEFDELLVTLMGAVDSTARFVHILLGLPAKGLHRAGWQRSDWLPRVADLDPTLAGLFESGTTLDGTLRILGWLRNTVHGELIRATMQQRGRSWDAPIRLPKDDEQKLLESFDAAGGRSAWGVRAGLDGSTLVDPGRFVEQLFPAVLTLLNTVLEHTPGVGAGAHRPSFDDGPRWYNQWHRLSVRWQLGVG